MGNKNSTQSSDRNRLDEDIKQLEDILKAKKSAQQFVQFLSPGTLFSETSTQAVTDLKDLAFVCKEAKKINARHGASPYGFKFVDGNGKALSGTYYITGKVLKYDDIVESDTTSILRSNMKCNGWAFVVENSNSYRTTREFDVDDSVIGWDGVEVVSGNDPALKSYRKAFDTRCKNYYGGGISDNKEF